MAEWKLDDGYFLDWENQVSIDAEVEFSLDPPSGTYTARPFTDEDRDLVINCEFELDVTHAVALDLLQLVPEKFRYRPGLIDFLNQASILTGSWFTNVRDIVNLLSPNTVGSTEYLRHLGALIGVVFPPEDETSEAEMRRTLVQAIDWYKIKGTYESVQIISLIQSFTVNLYDMYTDDYSTFYITDWFVGDEDENPPGFDSSYYKSPHFGIEVLLNQMYTGASGASGEGTSGDFYYLWETNYLDNLYDKVEETRPVHTVPHYLLLLNPQTDEFGHIIEVDGEIHTAVTTLWEISVKYFDMQGSTNQWNFDDGTYFDQSAEAFIKSVTKWVLGTGSHDFTASGFDFGSGFDLKNPALTGTIDSGDITIDEEKITYQFIVPKATVQNGISELGLYIPGSPDQLVIASVFPDINKDSRVELRVKVEIYKKDLS